MIVQVPDFGDRFWLYQMGDHRWSRWASRQDVWHATGFLMIVGPDWRGETPSQVSQVIHSRTNLATIMPRVLVSQTAEPALTLNCRTFSAKS